jgi:hypothetical protein
LNLSLDNKSSEKCCGFPSPSRQISVLFSSLRPKTTYTVTFRIRKFWVGSRNLATTPVPSTILHLDTFKSGII